MKVSSIPAAPLRRTAPHQQCRAAQARPQRRATPATTVGKRLPKDVFLVPQRQNDLVDTVATESTDDMLEHGAVDHRQHLLRCRQGQWPETGAEPSNQNNSFHVGDSLVTQPARRRPAEVTALGLGLRVERTEPVLMRSEPVLSS